MDMMTNPASAPEPIGFNGRMGNFIGLAIGNLLLTIVTFGIYRFWAKTKVRRHLWERTIFMGEPLEYRGRGIEKFIGALIVFAVLIVPLVIVQLIMVSMKSAGYSPVLGGLFILPLYFGLIWLFGVGIYRSQRYMFSRTAWRGIRGGMCNGGWAYGGLHLKMLLLQVITLGFALPYATTRLWNARMSDAMFGSLPVTADAKWRPLFRRFALAWIAALAIYVIVIGLVVATFGGQLAALKPGAPPPADPGAMLIAILKVYAIFIVGGIAIAVIMFSYYAAMLRELYGRTRIGSMDLQLAVSTGALLRFSFGNIAIIVFTLGLGIIVMPFRVFAFYARRLSTIGTLDVEALLQTDLAAPIQGDGLADAFDVGAF